MTKREIAELIFWAIWTIAALLFMTCCIISVLNSAYIEQDIEHNYVVFFGIEYGVGMGSLGFCGRMMGYGVAGLIVCGISSYIGPCWIDIHKFSDETE